MDITLHRSVRPVVLACDTSVQLGPYGYTPYQVTGRVQVTCHLSVEACRVQLSQASCPAVSWRSCTDRTS